MQKHIQDLFSDDMMIDDDEFDTLCCELLQVAPPATLVQQIMAAIEQSHPMNDSVASVNLTDFVDLVEVG